MRTIAQRPLTSSALTLINSLPITALRIPSGSAVPVLQSASHPTVRLTSRQSDHVPRTTDSTPAIACSSHLPRSLSVVVSCPSVQRHQMNGVQVPQPQWIFHQLTNQPPS